MAWPQNIVVNRNWIIIIIIIALDNAPYKMLHKLAKVRALSEKTNSEQVRLQVYSQKSLD